MHDAENNACQKVQSTRVGTSVPNLYDNGGAGVTAEDPRGASGAREEERGMAG